MSLSSALPSLPRLSPSSKGTRAHVTHRLARRDEEPRRARRAATTAMNRASSSASAASASPDQPSRQPPQQPQPLTEIRVCTNKACRRQGAEAIVKLSSDLSLPGVTTVKSGCLGVCGAGPNVAFLPQEVIASHVSTPARFLSTLETVAGITVSSSLMRATTLRLRGNALAREGDLKGAERVYTLALEGGGEEEEEESGLSSSRAGSGASASSSSSSPDPAPVGARHLLLSNRSGVRLALGDARGALSDAERAVAESLPVPGKWATALVRLAEARAALGDAVGAAEALREAREADPGVEEAVSRRKARKR